MFIPAWLIFLFTGLVMTLLTLFWATGSGQFEEQDRARFLPLHGLSAAELASPPPRRRTASFYGNLAILAAGALSIAFTLYLVVSSS